MNGKIERILKNTTAIQVDTAPIVCFIQKSPSYLSIVKEIFLRIDQGFISAISLFITLIELLIKPLELKDHGLANRYRDLLINSACFTLYPVERMVSEKAAELRANYGSSLKPPDAIQIATAISFGAQLFVTNDNRLKKVSEIKVVILEDLK